MSDATIAVVGSGIVGTAVAHALVQRGLSVEVFEKGPAFPYPHDAQFDEEIVHRWDNPAYRLPGDLKRLTASGDYGWDLDAEREMVAGGSATRWEAITLRMRPEDFRTRSLYRFGTDWPLGYDELEPWYGRAESLLGVSGTDADNPFAPPRTQPFPLPPFELAHDDVMLAERLRGHGITLHTTPQARTRESWDGRPGCVNFGTCRVCPIGARYSPNHHLAQAVETGLCRVRTDVSVRRIVTDDAGRAIAVVHRDNDGAADVETPVRAVVVAAGAIEAVRLLLLSAGPRHPDGLGNGSGQLGRHFTMHHLWLGNLRFAEPLYPGRFGGWTGQCQQFLLPEQRGRHGAVKVEFSSRASAGRLSHAGTREEILEQLRPRRHWRPIVLHAESAPDERKHVALSSERDRFGDPFAHVHYASSDFDGETYRYARRLFERFVEASGAADAGLVEAARYNSGFHHMGGCRMAAQAADGVVDPAGRVHGCPNVWVAGGATFPGTSGAVNPTLTMTALALYTADRLAAEAG